MDSLSSNIVYFCKMSKSKEDLYISVSYNSWGYYKHFATRAFMSGQNSAFPIHFHPYSWGDKASDTSQIPILFTPY